MSLPLSVAAFFPKAAEVIVPEAGSVAIYLLIDPRDNTVGYVGRSQNPGVRFGTHLSVAARKPSRKCDLPVSLWIRELQSAGLRPQMFVVAVMPSSEAGGAEDRLIKFYKKRGQAGFNKRTLVETEAARALREQWPTSKWNPNRVGAAHEVACAGVALAVRAGWVA